jgi:hypothetical protein
VDVPLAERALDGLGWQGTRRQRRAMADDEIEMPEVCARTGLPGACPTVSIDPRTRQSPGVAISIVQPGTRIPATMPAAASAKGIGMSTPMMAAAAVGAVVLIYLLGKR